MGTLPDRFEVEKTTIPVGVMKRRKCTTAMLLGSLSFISGVAGAQTPFNETGGTATTPVNEVGGQFTIDIITIRSVMPGIPLRFGGVFSGSETVDFGGDRLVKGKDYQIDYAAGVIYLMRAQKVGQVVRVGYRYDNTKSAQSVGKTQYTSGLTTMKFDLVPGGVTMMLGLGVAERQADGNVLLTNLYGWNNSMGGLKGLMLTGERSKVDDQSGYEYHDKAADPDTGRSKFILQNFASKLGGGTVEASYQDISSNFTSFGAVKDSGYEQSFVDQLSKERGLKRIALGLKDVSFGSGKISSGFKQVRDGAASIDWRSFALDAHGLKASYTSQSVDSDFTRFQDLGEGDRDQLRLEAGLKRQNFTSSLGSLSFSDSQVEDANGDGIYRRAVKLDTKNVSFNMGDQRIDPDFHSFNNLFEAEKGQWGREVGHDRTWMSLDATLFGTDKKNVFAYSTISNNGQRFVASDLNVGAKGWSIQHTGRSADQAFTTMNAMSESEMDTHIKAIANMYGPDVQTRPEDRGRFLQSNGLSRSYTRFAGSPFKDWQFQVDSLSLKGQTDSGSSTGFSLTGPRGSLTYRKEELGAQFAELNNMMDFERQRLGTISGLERSDFGLTMNLSKNNKLAVSQLDAQTAAGGAKRTAVAFTSPKIDVAVNTREVDSGFEGITQLVDPEKDLLAALRGFKERDAKVKWQILSNLKLDAFMADAQNEAIGQSNGTRNFTLNYNPDSKTSIELLQMHQKQADKTQTLFENLTQKISLSRDFGRFGKLTFFNENQDFEGSLSQNADFSRQYVAYQTQLNAKTQLTTEQTRTRYDNGDKEDINANTISTEISKKVGVSMTDIHVDRTGDQNDETKRNYGFWFDLGKGFKLSYGYGRQINGATGTMTSSLGLSPGTLDFLKVDAASYAENRWDGQHSQGLSNIALGSSHPLNMGFIKNFTFNFGMDTATDWSNWVRENRTASMAWNVGSNKIAMGYSGQMSANGQRGVDRTFSFETDSSDKRPLVGKFRISERSLPTDEIVTIRDVALTWKPTKGISVTQQMLTNPEDPQPRPDVPMFKVTNPWRVNKWTIAVDRNPSTAFAGSWEERINDITHENSRLTGLTLDLFKTSGSPVQLFYGVEQRWGNVDRSTAYRYYIKYDQRPGPNQLLSLFAGNVSYGGRVADGFNKSNWTINLNYQLRF